MERISELTRIVSAALVACVLTTASHAASFTVRISNETRKDGKQAPGTQADCWLPDGCTCVRGVIATHPMLAGLAKDRRFRKVASEEGLGTMVFDGIGNIQKLDQVLEQWARQSGHPELRGAAILTGGLSASCLAARVAAYEIPERVFGIVNVAGGNLHQPRRETILDIPFQLHVGQNEVFGPEGGIRPHLLQESQWYCLAEDIRVRRTQDPNALLSMVNIKNGKHGSWNADIAAMFVKKAAQLRLPKNEKRDGSKPARCIPINYKDGWLTDGEVKYTTHEPASYADYTGDKGKTLWHLDKELAQAVHDYHKKSYGEPGIQEQVWPLGKRMPVRLAAQRNPRKDFAAILGWLAERFERTPDDVVVRILAACLTRQINELDWQRERMLRDLGLEAVFRQSFLDALGWYSYSVVPFEQAVSASALPPEFKSLLLRRQMILSVWTMRQSDKTSVLMAMDRPLLGIPASIVENSSAVKLRPDRTFRQEIAARWPGFADASPVSQLLLYDALAEFNPCLEKSGSFRGPATAVKPVEKCTDLVKIQLLDDLYAIDPALRPEPDTDLQVETVALALKGGEVHAFRFNIRPERLFLIPNAKILASLANPRKADLRNVSISDASVLKELDAEELNLAGSGIADLGPLASHRGLTSLRLSETPVSDLAPIKALQLRSLDLAGTAVTDLTPLGRMPIESLVLANTAVSSLASLKGMRLKHLDVRHIPVTDLAPLSGLPLETMNLSIEPRYDDIDVLRRIRSLQKIDGVPLTEWLTQYKAFHAGPKGDPRLLPMPLGHKAPAGAGNWPARRGPGGTGKTAATGEDWIDDIAHARLVWTSETRLPATRRGSFKGESPVAAPAVGGLASPVVSDGHVYVSYYVPNGSAFAEDRIGRAPSEGRQRWRTDADDVLLCIDARTGLTLWRQTFVEAGYNLGARTEHPNCDMTPCVSNGRVYFLGSRARVHCVDAKTGAPIWTSPIGYRTWDSDYFAWMSHAMSKILWSREGFLGSVAAVADAAAVIDFRSSNRRTTQLGPSGLIGFDARTGAPIWEQAGIAGGNETHPRGWNGNSPDNAGFLVGDGKEIRFVRARGGEIAWSVESGTTRTFIATPSRLVCGRAESSKLAGYAVDTGKPRDLEWEPEPAMYFSDGSFPAEMADGTMVTGYQWKEKVEDEEGVTEEVVRNGLAVFDINRGKFVKYVPSPVSPTDILSAGNHVLVMSGGAATIWRPASNEPPMRPFPLPRAPETSPALAGGRLYLRSQDHILCYELRRDATRLDQTEAKACLEIVKSDALPRARDAGLALQNTSASAIPSTMATLTRYVAIQSDDTLAGLGGGSGKKRTMLGDEVRVVAAGEALASLGARPGVPAKDRDMATRSVAALLQYGRLETRLAACRALGRMGPAGRAALPAMGKAYLQVPLQEALTAAARRITGNPNHRLTIQIEEDEDDDLGLDLDL